MVKLLAWAMQWLLLAREKYIEKSMDSSSPKESQWYGRSKKFSCSHNIASESNCVAKAVNDFQDEHINILHTGEFVVWGQRSGGPRP